MPKARDDSVDVSDTDVRPKGSKSKVKKTDPPGYNRQYSDVDEEDEDENPDEDEDPEEPEYEIEAVVDHKQGYFEAGKIGYLVKWKGYGEEENSWVSEKDAGNAQLIIDEYWRKVQKDKKAPRKSGDAKAKAPVKRPERSSLVKDGTPTEETSAAPRKRGRLSKAQSDGMDVDDDNSKRSAKAQKVSAKASASTARKDAKKKTSISDEEDDDDDDGEVGTMTEYYSMNSWEKLVTQVDTIERSESTGQLIVYFTIKDRKGDKRVKEDSDICKKKFPQTLLKFYEGNLRWRKADTIDQ